MHAIFIVIIMNIFCQEFNISVCSAQRKLFLVLCYSDIIQFDNLLQMFLIAVIAVASHKN